MGRLLGCSNADSSNNDSEQLGRSGHVIGNWVGGGLSPKQADNSGFNG